jgi:hypothetical protein
VAGKKGQKIVKVVLMMSMKGSQMIVLRVEVRSALMADLKTMRGAVGMDAPMIVGKGGWMTEKAVQMK